MLGDGVNARPGDAVSREETMVLLARALGIKPVENVDMSDYKDAKKVSSWAEGYVAAMTDKGIVNGIDGSLQPASDINRASAMTILHKAISTYANQDGQVVSGTGDGIVLVAAKNVTVTGEADGIVVSAGAEGGQTNITAAKVESVTVQAADADVNITGSEVKDVAVEAPQAEVTLTNTKTENVEVSEKAEDAKVEVGTGSTVTNVENKADGTTVSGSGTVSNVTTSGDNTKVETGGTKVEAAPGTTGTTAGGQTVTGGGTATTTPTTPSTPSTPTVHIHYYADYKANGDGTHTGTCACKVTETTACEDGSDADTKCDKCGDETTAYVASNSNGKKYKTLAEAVAVGGTVKLLKSITLDATVEVPAGKTVILDLNGSNIDVALASGSEINHIYAFDNKGTFTLMGNGTITARGIFNNGIMTVKDGVTIVACDTNGGAAIWNYTDLTIDGGTFKVPHTGTSDDDAGPGCIYNADKLTINGGKFESNSARTYAIISIKTLVINNLTSVTGNHGAVAVDEGTATINGGSYSAKVSYAVYSDNGVVTVTGGTYAGTAHDLFVHHEGSITVTGGTYSEDISAFVADGYRAICDLDKNVWVVSKYERPTDLPVAEVIDADEHEGVALEWGNWGGIVPNDKNQVLESAYSFSATDTVDSVEKSPYKDWFADFYVYLDKDLGEGEILLAGNYGDYNWIGFNNPVPIAANTKVPLLGSWLGGGVSNFPYKDIVGLVKVFKCGVADVGTALDGATFTVELRLTNPDNPSIYHIVTTTSYTFK